MPATNDTKEVSANTINPQNFQNPAATYRPFTFWSWNDDLKEAELRRQVREMAEKGWGGFFMHSRVGLITPYLSEAWHRAAVASVDEAEKTGIQAWLYDEDRWPSGFAGGLLPVLGKQYQSKGLILKQGALNPECETLVRPAKSPLEGKQFVLKNRKADGPYGKNLGYVDWLNPETLKKFFEVTMEGYERHVGAQFGKTVPGIFFDEPVVLDSFGLDEIALPWTPDFPEKFEARNGYSILPHLEKLFCKKDDFYRIRHDFFATVTDLYVENFTKAYQQLCRDKKLIFTGHYNGEENVASQPIYSGAVMPHYEFEDWPGVDKLDRNIKYNLTFKQVSSVADQLGKERVLCEAYGCSGQQFDFAGRRWVHNWEAALGVNAIVYHLSLYSACGERKRDYPPNFFYQQPWWPYEKNFSDYIGRVNYALSQGKRVCDILVLHPSSSAWALYDAGAKKAWWDEPAAASAMKPYAEQLANLTDELLQNRLDFHFGDETILRRHGKVEGQIAQVGQFAYRFVVVPPAFTWQKSTLDWLRQFYKQGGVIIFSGETAQMEDAARPLDCRAEFPNAIFTEKQGVKGTVSALLQRKSDAIGVTDLLSGKNADTVFVHERQLDSGERLLFLTNTAEKIAASIRVTLPYLGEVQAWSLENGKKTPVLPSKVREDGMELDLTLHPGDAVLWSVDRKAVPPTAPPAVAPSKKAVALQDWKVQPLDENALPIDKAQVHWDGMEKADSLAPRPLNHFWDAFYKLPEGTPFTAEYAFEIESVPASPVFAVIERAENLDKIFINGIAVFPNGDFWCDRLFGRVPLIGHLKPGTNRLRIEGRKYNVNLDSRRSKKLTDAEYPAYRESELEPISIVGDFLVLNRDNRHFTITPRPADTQLHMGSVGEQGYPFAVGRFACRSEFVAKEEGNYHLELSGVKAPCAEVLVNGKLAGILYWAPYELDLSAFVKKGKNKIELIFPTDLFNLMGPSSPDIGLPELVAPGTFRLPQPDDRLLLPYGIASARVMQKLSPK